MPQVIRLWPLVTPQNPTAQTVAGNTALVELASKVPQCKKGLEGEQGQENLGQQKHHGSPSSHHCSPAKAPRASSGSFCEHGLVLFPICPSGGIIDLLCWRRKESQRGERREGRPLAATRTQEDSLEPREGFLHFEVESKKLGAVCRCVLVWLRRGAWTLQCNHEQAEEEVGSDVTEHTRL